MKSILKLIKRFIVTMLFTLVLLFFLNLFLFLLVSYRQAANHGAWSSADTVASALTQNRDGTYPLWYGHCIHPWRRHPEPDFGCERWEGTENGKEPVSQG